MNIKLMELTRQYNTIKEEIDKTVIDIVSSGQYILGAKVAEFEKSVSDYIGVKHAIGVGNGTDALVLSLKALGIKPGDEVIVPAMSFFASSESVLIAGGIPVFVDIDEENYGIDSDAIVDKITDKTKAIIAVHLYGQPCDMESIMKIAKKHNLFVIEDAAQAIGSSINNQMIGSFGDVACISFFPTKNLGCYGDGGVILTNNKELDSICRGLRVHGSGQNGIIAADAFGVPEITVSEQYEKFTNTKYFNSIAGYNSRLDAIQAGILNVKLQYLDGWNKRRNQIANEYNRRIKGEFVLPKTMNDTYHVYYVYVLLVKGDRQKFIDYLNENEIGNGIYFPVPLHLQRAHVESNHKVGDFPVAEMLSSKSVAIPMYPELSDIEVDYIIDKINDYKEV